MKKVGKEVNEKILEEQVVIKVTKSERENILYALRLWLKLYDVNVFEDLNDLIEKVDCAGGN